MSTYALVREMKKILTNMNGWLDKAVAFAGTKKFEPDSILSWRLSPDMLPFSFQIQSACDAAKYAASRAAGKESPSHPDTETTVAALKQRIDTVCTYLDTFTEKDFAGDQAQPASASEVDELTSLAKRRSELDAREAKIQNESNILAATDTRVDAKIAQLKSLQTQITGLLAQRDVAQEKQVASLVKTYSAMKPKDAARIFENLSEDVLLPVAEEMKSDVLAPVLAAMSPDQAQKLTVKLASKLTLPVTADVTAPAPAAAPASAGAPVPGPAKAAAAAPPAPTPAAGTAAPKNGG